VAPAEGQPYILPAIARSRTVANPIARDLYIYTIGSARGHPGLPGVIMGAEGQAIVKSWVRAAERAE